MNECSLSWVLSKTIQVTASIMLAVFIFPSSAVATNLGTLSSVSVDGATMTQGSVVTRDSFSSITNFWTTSFSWPYSVPNSRAGIVVFKGTFGALDGGAPVSGQNYALTLQSWGAGNNTITKQFNLPMLGAVDTSSGQYTVVVADIATAPDMYNKFVEWFATGGVQGFEPNHYATLTFTYSATSNPTVLADAIQSVTYSGVHITNGAEVPKEDLGAPGGTLNQFWTFRFAWPNAVANQNALLMVFRGTYGALDGGVPVSGVNYGATVQAWASGQNELIKQINIPPLTDLATEPGIYTVMVAERDSKYSANPISQEALWFASGGAQGVAPRKYSLLTFTLTTPPKCCSSVLFLPGFMASRLYKDTNRLWEPGLSTDTSELLMDANGAPTVTGIYAPTVLGTAGTTDIYDSFLTSLDTITGPEDGKIMELRTYPYDWRLSVSDPAILDALVVQLEDLAHDSKTGKVSIVAHSNGGLLAKQLMVHLGDTRAAELVDKLILVGSPQIGTPKAVGALLHGYEQGIPSFLPFLLSEDDARHLAKNMYGAYGLIPSAAYFNTVTEPLVHFDGLNSPFVDQMKATYGLVVGNTTEYRSFLTGGEGRTDALYSDLVHPSVLPAAQHDAMQALHTTIDSWTPPASVEVYQIAGWGEETVKGFEYLGRQVCIEGYCKEQIRTLPEFTMDGDGTVVAPSALYMSDTAPNVHRYWFNLDTYNADNPVSTVAGLLPYSHASLFGANDLKNLVRMILLDGNGSPNNYVSTVRPTTSNTRLRYFLHSPLRLSARDLVGNEISGSLAQVPGARFEKFGEVQYISIPASATPTVHLDAFASGSFILDIQEVNGDAVVATTSFVGIPNTQNTDVTISFPNGTLAGAGPLQIDKNGDGVVDYVVPTHAGAVAELPKAPITITAVSKAIVRGAQIPQLTYTMSGFVAGETRATSDITGDPICTTTAQPTSPVGVYPITCTVGTLASDYYMFEQFISGTLTITYPWSGFQQPIDDPAAQAGATPSVFKAGSTVPVKFKLRDASGNIVQATVLPEWLTPTQGAKLTASVDEPVFSDPATTGNTYRWDSTSQQYIYNWSTKGLAAGYWYKIYAKLDDGTIKSVMVGLR